MFVAVTLMTILLFIPFKGKNTEVVRYVSFSVMWTFLLLYETANITVILFFGTIFNRGMYRNIFLTIINSIWKKFNNKVPVY